MDDILDELYPELTLETDDIIMNLAIKKDYSQIKDFDKRKELVAEELDQIMSWATYMPVYQRKELWIYNPDTVNTDTIPENTSTYYNYVNEIHSLELK